MEKEKKPTVLGLQKELSEFKGEVLELLQTIANDKSETKTDAKDSVEVTQVGESITVTEKVDGLKNNSLPPNYQAIFEEHFDPNDGFTAEMSFDNNIEFTINVPLKFSNATSAHLSFYGEDKRTKVLHQGNIEGGIEEWCKLVAKNLKYNKDLLTK